MKHACLLLTILALVGCDTPVGSFATNDVYLMTLARSRDTQTEQVAQDLPPVVEDLFGTPDQPKWPAQANQILPLNQSSLARAAGKISSEEDGTHRGLFREHCVVCHALPGSGAGPAALFQNPYPRDFRPGVYKWKSTVRDAKPTREDLATLLHRGVPGSGMPSFALIDESDREALVDYIVYLSVRGEVERQLMAASIDELGYGEEDDIAKLDSDEGRQSITQAVTDVATSWAEADGQVVSVPDMPQFDGDAQFDGDVLAQSIQRGDAIFHGQIANCVGCHGPGGAGGVPTVDFDDWTKEYSTRLGIDPKDRDAIRPFKKAGALTPRLAKPRDLTDGVFHGGGDTATLYRRFTQGIAGSPMPGVRVVETEDGTGLTQSQLFDLIRYVQSLGDGT